MAESLPAVRHEARDLIAYLVGALGLAGGAVVALWLRWKLERARDDAALWHEQAKRLTDDLVLAAEQVKRLEEENRVLRDELTQQGDFLAALATAHPELVGDYVREQLRKAARLTSDPRAHATLSAGSAAGVPGVGGGKRIP